MPFYRVQVAVERGNDMTADDCVNTFYLQDIGVTSDPDALAQDSANLWATFRPYPSGVTRITAKIYDMQQLEPRLPIATKTNTSPLDYNGSAGPSEVALCLSFYASVNQPRRRGRLFIGPWSVNSMDLRPPLGTQNEGQDLAVGLANLGGIDVDWTQYSPTNDLANKVTNWWVDNEWDTIRSRGLQPTTRISGTTGE